MSSLSPKFDVPVRLDQRDTDASNGEEGSSFLATMKGEGKVRDGTSVS
jgi:hypothetical protein